MSRSSASSPRPAAAPFELVSGRKRDNGKIIGWRIYRRNKGDTGLPDFARRMGRRHPAHVAWWSATDANICMPIKQGMIRFQLAQNLSTTTSPADSSKAPSTTSLQVNHTCPAS